MLSLIINFPVVCNDVWICHSVATQLYVNISISAAKNKTEEIRTQLFSELNRVDNASEPFVS